MKVLVVDDEPVLRMLIVDSLEEEELEIEEAENGIEALEKMKEQPFDLVLLDYMMPGKTGVDVVKEMKETPGLDTIKVMMLTAKSQKQDEDEMLAAGADFLMTKPFSPLALVDKVLAILEAS